MRVLTVFAAVFIATVTMAGWSSPVAAVTVPEAQPDKGLVVFYRPKKTAGSAIRFDVNHAQGSLGSLNNGTMVFRYFEPGSHQFWSQVIAQDGITINVEPGQVYFVRGDVKMGIYAGRPNFTLVGDKLGRADIAKL